MNLRRFFALLLFPLLLSACAVQEKYAPCTTDVLAMDTVMTLTVYPPSETQGREILQKAAAKIAELDAQLSVTNENSEIYRANHSGGTPAALSDNTRRLLEQSLDLCASTNGALDVTVYPVVRAWGFTTQEYRVPEQTVLAELLSKVDYRQVSLEGNSLSLPAGVELDLGAVAKGCTGDQLMELFTAEGVTSAIVSLGGNVQTLGAKPDGSPWRVALQAPEGGYAAVLEVVDKAVVTSGGYQRFFVQDGETYIHIINPDTGYPADTGLASVTIVSDCGTQGDGLSTALFVMGRDDAVSYWRTHRDFEFVLLTEDGRAVITEGLEDCFSLYGEWMDRTVEIVR